MPRNYLVNFSLILNKITIVSCDNFDPYICLVHIKKNRTFCHIPQKHHCYNIHLKCAFPVIAQCVYVTICFQKKQEYEQRQRDGDVNTQILDLISKTSKTNKDTEEKCSKPSKSKVNLNVCADLQFRLVNWIPMLSGKLSFLNIVDYIIMYVQ